MTRHLRHLVVRFFGVLRATPLTPAEQTAVDQLLRAEEKAAFWAQQAPDQRHALQAATICRDLAPNRRDLERAALLHDIGKRHAGLGVAGRVAASLIQILRLPARGRILVYLDHGSSAAAELEAAGAEDIVVAFARSHHAAHPPQAIDAADWAILRAADGE